MATKEELHAIEAKMTTKEELRDLEEKIDVLELSTKQEFQSINEKMATKFDVIRLENKMDKNFGALFDGLTLLNEKIDRLESKVEIHDLEMKVMKKAIEKKVTS